MPLPKSLRRSIRRNSSSASSVGTSQRRKCRTCNNLDPRGHANSVEDAEVQGEIRASLSLVLDALILSNVKSTTGGGCRFCVILTKALDAYFEKWRGARCRVNVDIQEKGTIKLSLDGSLWIDRSLEIYAGSGRHCVSTNPLHPLSFYSRHLCFAQSTMARIYRDCSHSAKDSDAS